MNLSSERVNTSHTSSICHPGLQNISLCLIKHTHFSPMAWHWSVLRSLLAFLTRMLGINGGTVAELTGRGKAPCERWPALWLQFILFHGFICLFLLLLLLVQLWEICTFILFFYLCVRVCTHAHMCAGASGSWKQLIDLLEWPAALRHLKRMLGTELWPTERAGF